MGDMYDIKERKEIKKRVGKKNIPNEIVILNPNNNIWLDIQKTLSTIVRFCDISMDEAHGKSVFVIKLDEME
jgi:hypothetical protein